MRVSQIKGEERERESLCAGLGDSEGEVGVSILTLLQPSDLSLGVVSPANRISNLFCIIHIFLPRAD